MQQPAIEGLTLAESVNGFEYPGRCDLFAIAALPAQQCLGTHERAGAHVELWLVMQYKLLLAQAMAQVDLQGQGFTCPDLELGGIEVETGVRA